MEFSTALKLPKLIGRKRVTEALKNAIKNGQKALIIVGKGGIGKTHILENIGEFFENNRELISDKELVILDIVDFYHGGFHSVKGFVPYILDNIGKKIREKDVNLSDKLLKLSDRLESGDIPIDGLPGELDKIFDELSEKYYFVFRFDTMEVLEYGGDDPEVLEDCEVPPDLPVPPVKCLKETFSKLNYGFAIFAGRPTYRKYPKGKNLIYFNIADGYGDSIYREEDIPFIELTGFTEEETREYIEAVLEEIKRLPDYKEHKKEYEEIESKIRRELLDSTEGFKKLHLLTEGRPIYVALSLEWLARGMPIREISEKTVDEIQKELPEIRPKFEAALVEKIAELDEPLVTLIRFAARFRKGFTKDMMAKLLKAQGYELSDEELNRLLERFQKLSFVKSPHIPHEKRYFLHDEMFDLVDKYVWKKHYQDKALDKQKEISKFISENIYGDWKKGLIGEAYSAIGKEAQNFPKWLSLRRRAEQLLTEKLFYELNANPLAGYYLYDVLDTIALSQRRGEWDEFLRSELIRFVRINEEREDVKQHLMNNGGMKKFVNKFSRLRWLRRFRVKQIKNRDEIVRIAWKIFDKFKGESEDVIDHLWHARFHTLMGVLLREKGIYDEIHRKNNEPYAREQLNTALDWIEKVKGKIEEKYREVLTSQIKDPELWFYTWMSRHFEGLARLHLGLVHRALGDSDISWQLYQEAQEIFKLNEEDFSVARAMNNQAYIESRMGKYSDAYSKIQEAIRTRQNIGDFDGYTLSLVVRGIIEDRMGLHSHALKDVKFAKEIVKKVYPTRLVPSYIYGSLTQARALRHLAEKTPNVDAAMDYLDRAMAVLRELEENVSIFEPFYQWEYYNEAGQVFTRKVRIAGAGKVLGKRELSIEKAKELLEIADYYFGKADAIAGDKKIIHEQIDNRDDWCWLSITKLENYDVLKPKKSKKELYERALNTIIEGKSMAEYTKDSIVLVRVDLDDPYKLAPRYYEMFYRLGSLYKTEAYIKLHYGEMFDENLKEDEKRRIEVIKLLLKSNILFDLFTDEPVERATETRTWLSGELQEIEHARKVEHVLKEAIGYVKSTMATGIKADKRLIEDLKKKSPRPEFVFHENGVKNFVMLKLKYPAEYWDELSDVIDEELLKGLKHVHQVILKTLPVWSEITLAYPRIDIYKLIEEA